MIARRRFTIIFALVLVSGLSVPAVRGGDIVVNFNDLSYSGGGWDPNELYPVGQAPGTGSYNNGWNLNGGFTSDGVYFSNYYNSTYYYWGNWGYSNVNDPTTTGSAPFTTDVNHQFAAITGTAPGGSGNYAIETGTGGVINLPSGTSPVSFEVTNSTYSYLAMTVGDGFTTAPFSYALHSFFELKIYGWMGLNGGGNEVGEVDFYLANYTSANSLPVDVWTLVDLSTLGGAQSLTFDYASSDVGQFGINTPEYFAMDSLILNTSVPEPSSATLALIGLGIAGLAGGRNIRRRLAQTPVAERGPT
jgi:Domain of unknown function (DUF4465)/PEP-CTERM motif